MAQPFLGKGFCALEKKSKFYLRWFSKKKEIDATILLANDSVYVASMTMFFFYLEPFVFLKYINQGQCILSLHNDTAMYMHRPENLMYTPVGLEPGIFCSGGGRDDHFKTPPGHY
jgi:hypothetical protein